MARKTKISKEIILEAALEMLIQDGFDAINIKTLSAKIGCSTQPLVWHFDNMEGLRKALSEYALEYANEKMRPNCENVLEAFEYVGKQYLCIALNESKLFRFLYLEGYCGETANHFDALAEDQENQELVNGISKQLEISKECASRYVRNAIIFTHGIASFVATGVIKASFEEMIDLMHNARDTFWAKEGIIINRKEDIL